MSPFLRFVALEMSPRGLLTDPIRGGFCLSGASQMQVSRLFWICRAHRDKCPVKPQVRAVTFRGVLGLLQKVYSLGFFLLEDRCEGKQLPQGGHRFPR